MGSTVVAQDLGGEEKDHDRRRDAEGPGGRKPLPAPLVLVLAFILAVSLLLALVPEPGQFNPVVLLLGLLVDFFLYETLKFLQRRVSAPWDPAAFTVIAAGPLSLVLLLLALKADPFPSVLAGLFLYFFLIGVLLPRVIT